MLSNIIIITDKIDAFCFHPSSTPPHTFYIFNKGIIHREENILWKYFI